jgi:WD40 repeat protein
VSFSSDNKTILTAGRYKKALGEILQYRLNYKGSVKDVSARLWDVNSGKLLHTITEHQNDIWNICFSNDGNWVASSSVDKTVKLWKLK